MLAFEGAFDYGPTLAGAFVGMLWAFVDGYIAGIVIAWIYNRLAR